MVSAFRVDGQQFSTWADAESGIRYVRGEGRNRHLAKLMPGDTEVRDWKIYKGQDLVWYMRLKGPAWDDEEIIAEKLLKLDRRIA